MSMGNPTDLGILRYLTTTARTTFAAMLNQGIDAINTYLRDTMRAGDTGWINITSFTNGWTSDVQPAYRRLNGVVYLRGRVTGGSTASAFTLPVGFRPSQALRFATPTGTTTTSTGVLIGTDGTVTCTGATSPNFSMCFPAS